MKNTSGLSCALFGDTRVSILSVFFRNPEQSFYLRQVIRLVGAGQGAVQRELKSLADAGILTMTRSGHQVYFRANPDCPIYSELRNLILKTSGLADVLHAAFLPLSGRIRVAFVYGSFANGRDTAASDVDVMVVGDVAFADIAHAVYEAQQMFGREINPTVYPVDEFYTKTAEPNSFLYRTLFGKKIFIIGDENELARLAGKRLVD